MKILHLGKPTPGDENFYNRWAVIGKVSTTMIDPDIIVTDQYTPISDEMLHFYSSVKFVCSPTTGHTHLKFSPSKHDVKIISLRNQHDFMQTITSVAEFTMNLIHRCAREIPSSPIKLSGKNMGIIGNGRVGSKVGKACEALGMSVKYFDKEHNRHYLKSVFRYSDFISIHLSETRETIGMIDSMYLNLLRPNAFLINTARSSIVDEIYLREMILQDRIGGVASDVSPIDSPININHPKVIMTRHVGGRCLEDRIATDKFILEELRNRLDLNSISNDVKLINP